MWTVVDVMTRGGTICGVGVFVYRVRRAAGWGSGSVRLLIECAVS